MRKQALYLLATQLLSRIAEEQTFEDAIKDKKFKNSETGNEVQFSSLPAEDQEKVRAEWQKHLDKNKEEDKDEEDDEYSLKGETKKLEEAKKVSEEAEEKWKTATKSVGEAKEKVSKAKEKMSKADKELKSYGMSERDITRMKGIVKGEGLHGKDGLYFDQGPPFAYTSERNLDNLLGKLGPRNLDIAGDGDWRRKFFSGSGVSEADQKQVGVLFSMVTGHGNDDARSFGAHLPLEALKSKDGFDKWSKGIMETFEKSMNKVVSQGDGGARGKDKGLTTEGMNSLVQKLKTSMQKAMDELTAENPEIEDAWAVSEHLEAEEELKKSEEELKKSEGEVKKSHSELVAANGAKSKAENAHTRKIMSVRDKLDKMTHQELLKEYEKRLDKQKMNPEEKEQAIKSMKEKDPDEIKREAPRAIMKPMFGKPMVDKPKGDEEGTGKTATLRRAGHLMAEIRMNERRIASLEQRLAGAMDKPRQLQKGTWKIPVRAGHVLLSQWAVKHITAHNDIGTGSVFSRGMDEKTLIKLIQNAPVKGAGGLYTMKAPGVGYNLVLPIEKAMSLPNATQIAVYKEERGKKIEVIGVKTSAPLKAFATNEVSLVIRPSNPQFLPDDAKQVPAIVKDVKDGLSYSVLSAFPGDPNIPPASQWNGKFAVIIPS